MQRAVNEAGAATDDYANSIYFDAEEKGRRKQASS